MQNVAGEQGLLSSNFYHTNLLILLKIQTVMNSHFFNDTATTEIYTLSLHDALPIYYGL